MKKLAQPTRSFFTLKISWKTSPGWLQLVFHFGTENWADQLKKPPCSRLLESSGKMGQVDQNWGTEYEHFYFGRLKNYKITHIPPHFTMFKSINRVLLCLIQLLTEGVNLSVSQIFAMKLRFPLRQAGVDSDLVQNIWVIIWWVGARGPTRLGISEFTQIFWVFPVYVAHFWQTFWVNWQNGSNWSNLRLRISVSALERLKNHNIPHLRPNFTTVSYTHLTLPTKA